MDELFIFIGNKKQDIHPDHSRSADTLFLGQKVVWESTQPAIQELVDAAPNAKQYFSDAYAILWYHFGRYEVSEGITDKLLVEGDSEELPHYLALRA